MKDALASDSSSESYVVEIDGVPKFEFRVFAKALFAALQLRPDHPNCTVKLRAADEARRCLYTEPSCRDIYTASLRSRNHKAHVSNNKKGPLQRAALKFVW